MLVFCRLHLIFFEHGKQPLHGKQPPDHVKILSPSGEGFFEAAGYLEIEDHKSNAWTPSTAISEVASKQNALAKKRVAAAQATHEAATAVQHRHQHAATLLHPTLLQRQQQAATLQQRQQTAEARTRELVDKSSSKRKAEMATLDTVAPPKTQRYHDLRHLSLDDLRLRHNASCLKSYHNMKPGGAGRSRAAPKPPPTCLTPQEAKFWVRINIFLLIQPGILTWLTMSRRRATGRPTKNARRRMPRQQPCRPCPRATWSSVFEPAMVVPHAKLERWQNRAIKKSCSIPNRITRGPLRHE